MFILKVQTSYIIFEIFYLTRFKIRSDTLKKCQRILKMYYYTSGEGQPNAELSSYQPVYVVNDQVG
jgi:hypothetical protein